MIRIVIENVLLFVMPTAVYLAYVYLVRKEGGAGNDVLAEAPLLWLSASGAVLVLAAMILFGSTKGGTPSQGYEPPEMQNGKIVPGRQQ
jgi:ABC-type Fe3+ transport system permease subunit